MPTYFGANPKATIFYSLLLHSIKDPGAAPAVPRAYMDAMAKRVAALFPEGGDERWCACLE